MDTTQLKMVSDSLTSQIAQLQGQLDGVNQAIKVLTDGYQTDQAAIDQAVSDQVTAALTPVQTAVNSTLSTLANAKTSIVADPATPAPAIPATDTQA